MKQAITDENDDLIQRGTFKVTKKENLPHDDSALTARFILVVKTDAEGKIKYKARYVIGGPRDNMKNYLIQGAQTLQQSTVRLLIALISCFNFKVCSSDDILLYLHPTELLIRRVLIWNLSTELRLKDCLLNCSNFCTGLVMLVTSET